jgi:hypothetical protein
MAPAKDWPSHIIIEDSVHLRVSDGEYRQFRVHFYVGGPGVLVSCADTWENACVVCEVRQHGTPHDTDVSVSAAAAAGSTSMESPLSHSTDLSTTNNVAVSTGPGHDSIPSSTTSGEPTCT